MSSSCGASLFFRGAENFISDPEGFLIHHKWTWNVVNIELQQVSSRRLLLTRQILETDTLPFRKLCKSTARKRDEWKNQTKFNCRLHDLFRQRDFFFSSSSTIDRFTRVGGTTKTFSISPSNSDFWPYAGKISSHDSIYVTAALKLEKKGKKSNAKWKKSLFKHILGKAKKQVLRKITRKKRLTWPGERRLIKNLET